MHLRRARPCCARPACGPRRRCRPRPWTAPLLLPALRRSSWRRDAVQDDGEVLLRRRRRRQPAARPVPAHAHPHGVAQEPVGELDVEVGAEAAVGDAGVEDVEPERAELGPAGRRCSRSAAGRRGGWPRSGRSRRLALCWSIASKDATTSASSVSRGAEVLGDDLAVPAEQLVQEARAGSRRPSTPWSRSGGRGCRTGCRRRRRCRARWWRAGRARRTAWRRGRAVRRVGRVVLGRGALTGAGC